MTCSLFLLMCWCILSDSSHWVVHPHIAFGRSVAPDTDAARRDPEAFMDALCQVILRDRRYSRWTNYSTLDNFIPRPPKFQSCFLLPTVETGGQKKSNPTAWHVTHTLGTGVSVQSFPQGLNILSIYGIRICRISVSILTHHHLRLYSYRQ